MRNGDENADDIAGRFTGTYTGADARSCKYGTTCEITDKKGKGLPESGKGEALEIPLSPEKEPVSCLTDWHYPGMLGLFITCACIVVKPNVFKIQMVVNNRGKLLCYIIFQSC